jgi:hypothetical protein
LPDNKAICAITNERRFSSHESVEVLNLVIIIEADEGSEPYRTSFRHQKQHYQNRKHTQSHPRVSGVSSPRFRHCDQKMLPSDVLLNCRDLGARLLEIAPEILLRV